MANLSLDEVREMSMQDLQERIEETSLQYKKKKFAHAVSPLENPLELRWNRRDVARLKTELSRRQLENKEQ
jgi:large subunit ribosomal protein L29